MQLSETLSASVLAELLRPALIVCAALLSTLVLAYALRINSPFYLAAAWALATFLLPHIVLPLYIAVRLLSRGDVERRVASQPRRRFTRWAFPSFVYAVLLFTAISIFYWHDYHTFDAYLERAAAARLRERHTVAIEEYEQALRLQPDAHTQKLLALELISARHYAQALEQFRLLEEAGANDESLNFYVARALDGLKRSPEAQTRYEAFSRSNLCTQNLPDARCQLAGERLAAIVVK